VNAAFCQFHAKEEKKLLGADFFQTLDEKEVKLLRESLQSLTVETPVLNFDHRAVAGRRPC